jgi:hypothetical protein
MGRFEIRCVGNGALLDRVDADGELRALDVYAERMGFPAYAPPLPPPLRQGLDDDSCRPYLYSRATLQGEWAREHYDARLEGRWLAPFTNYEIYAVQAGSVCRDCAREDDPLDAHGRCDSCATQARYDRAAEGADLAAEIIAVFAGRGEVGADYADKALRLARLALEEWGPPLLPAPRLGQAGWGVPDWRGGDYLSDGYETAQAASDAAALRLIADGQALSAEVENALQERGLIVQTDQPYATLTDAGRSLLSGQHGQEAWAWECSCGAGPFGSVAAVADHAAQWHPDREWHALKAGSEAEDDDVLQVSLRVVAAPSADVGALIMGALEVGLSGGEGAPIRSVDILFVDNYDDEEA